MTNSENNGKKIVYAAILTPYLSGDFEKECKSCPKVNECVEKQRGFGYDANNFNGVRKFETLNHVVMLETGKDHTTPSPSFADFAVAGNTFLGEMQVRALSRGGLLIARYSTFYPEKSEYTDTMPGDAGYSLDIPKKVSVVKAFITDDAVLDALVSREEEKIRSAVENFNQGRAEPVLVTPFLSEALRVRKND